MTALTGEAGRVASRCRRWSLTDDSLALDLNGDPEHDLAEMPPPDTGEALRATIVPGWQQQAACAGGDPEAWFEPVDEAAGGRDLAASEDPGAAEFASWIFDVCAGCPVRRPCLAAAMVEGEHGVWAGTLPADRIEGAWLLASGVAVDGVLDRLLDQAAALNVTPTTGRAA